MNPAFKVLVSHRGCWGRQRGKPARNGPSLKSKTATEAAVHSDSIVTILIADQDHRPSDRQEEQRSDGTGWVETIRTDTISVILKLNQYK